MGLVLYTTECEDEKETVFTVDEYLDGERGEIGRLDESLHWLGQAILRINEANGWEITDPGAWEGLVASGGKYKLPAIIALIHSEASEALEAYRNRDMENFKEEMGDILIRVLDCMAGLEMDIVGPIIAKLKKNRTRGHRHGGKLV